MISFKSHGDWEKSFRFLHKAAKLDIGSLLEKYAQQGVDALSAATPVDTGRAASSWRYDIEVGRGESKITWLNDDIEGGYNVVLLVQYGHATKNGGYIQGRDFINPAMRPVFDNMIYEIWKEVEGL